MTMLAFFATVFVGVMMTPRSVMMTDSRARPLAPKIEARESQQQYTRQPRKPLHLFFQLKSEPRDRQSEQTRKRDVAQAGERRDQQGFPSSPTSRARHQHERQPVRGNRRVHERDGKSGRGNGRE